MLVGVVEVAEVEAGQGRQTQREGVEAVRRGQLALAEVEQK
jgi:hypothetical protein